VGGRKAAKKVEKKKRQKFESTFQKKARGAKRTIKNSKMEKRFPAKIQPGKFKSKPAKPHRKKKELGVFEKSQKKKSKVKGGLCCPTKEGEKTPQTGKWKRS